MKKVAFLGFDFFYSCMEALDKTEYQVKWLFITPRDNEYEFNTKVINKAKELGADIIEERINKSHIGMLKQEGCDLIISAAYPHKIPVIVNSPFMINIHPALLPIGRGPWPMPCAILKNLKEYGVTIHKVSEKLDEGDILLKESFPISDEEDLETLSCKCQMKAKELLMKILSNFEHYWTSAIPQGKGEYWPNPTNEERTLDWTLPVTEIKKISRALGKFDSFAIFDEKEWIVEDLSVWKENHTILPGTVVHRTNKEVVIAASDGFVCLRHFFIDPDFEN